MIEEALRVVEQINERGEALTGRTFLYLATHGGEDGAIMRGGECVWDSHEDEREDCPRCRGGGQSGEAGDEECPDCQGWGKEPLRGFIERELREYANDLLKMLDGEHGEV